LKSLHQFNYLFSLNISLICGVFVSLEGSRFAVAYAWAGWLIYLVLSVFLKAFFKIEESRLSLMKVLGTTASLVLPLIGLILINGYEGAYNYFIMGSAFEAAGLYTALVFLFLFGTGVDGQRSFDSLGIGFVLIFLVIITAFFIPYVLIVWDYYNLHGVDIYSLLFALIGVLSLTLNWTKDILNLRNLSMKGLFKEEDENPLRSVGMIVLWMLGLNLVYVFATL